MEKSERGLLIIYSGPSGVGKGTVRDAVFKSNENQFDYSVSMTTRHQRPGEVEGKEYFFTTREVFEEKIKAGQMLEYSEYVGNYYGTPLEYVNQTLSDGKDIFLEVDVAGARQIKEKMPDSISIFLAPPDTEELRERLRGRGTESDDVINERLRKASEELVTMGEYDHVVVNDDVTAAAERVLTIIQERKELKMTEIKVYKATMEAAWEQLKATIPELPHDSAFPETVDGLRFETGAGTWDDELMMLYANDPDNKVFPEGSSYSYNDLTDFLYSPYSDMRQRFSIVSDVDLPEVDVAEHGEIAFYTEAESGSEALPTETAQYLKETEGLYQKYLPERIETLKRHILNHVQISPEVERQYDEIMAHLALGNLDKANLALPQHNSFIRDTEFEYDLDNEGFNLLTADESGKGFDYAAAELNAKYFSFLPSEEAERLWLQTDLQFKKDKYDAQQYIYANRDKIDIAGNMMQDIAEARFFFEEEGLNIKIGENTFVDNRSFLEALQEQYSDRGLGEGFVQVMADLKKMEEKKMENNQPYDHIKANAEWRAEDIKIKEGSDAFQEQNIKDFVAAADSQNMPENVINDEKLDDLVYIFNGERHPYFIGTVRDVRENNVQNGFFQRVDVQDVLDLASVEALKSFNYEGITNNHVFVNPTKSDFQRVNVKIFDQPMDTMVDWLSASKTAQVSDVVKKGVEDYYIEKLELTPEVFRKEFNFYAGSAGKKVGENFEWVDGGLSRIDAASKTGRVPIPNTGAQVNLKTNHVELYQPKETRSKRLKQVGQRIQNSVNKINPSQELRKKTPTININKKQPKM